MAVLHIELIERLNTAAQTAENIYKKDKEYANRIRGRILEAQKDLREAERIARQSGNQYRKLSAQVMNMTKRYQVTSIQYNPDNGVSRAIFE